MSKIKISNGTVERMVSEETYLNKWSKVGYKFVKEVENSQSDDLTKLKLENESLKVENTELKTRVEQLEAEYELLEKEYLEYKADVGNNFNDEMIQIENDVVDVEEIAVEETEVEEQQEPKTTHTEESLKGLKKAELCTILEDLKVDYDSSDTNDELRKLILKNA